MKRFFFTRIAVSLGAILLCVMLSACNSENPEPEKLEPLFNEFSKRIEVYQKEVADLTAKIKGLYESLEKAEPNSIERKDILRDIAKAKQKKLDSEQWLRYYIIRRDRKAVMDRIAYKKALAEGRPWPDPREYSEYQVNRRLVESNRNWATRVPKLTDRLPGSDAAPKKKEAPKSGH